MDGNYIQPTNTLGTEIAEENEISGRKQVIKFIIGAVIVVLVLIVVFFIVGKSMQNAPPKTDNPKPSASDNGSADKPATNPTTQNNLHSTAIRAKNPTIKYSEQAYKDSLQITKYIELENTVVHCFFKGVMSAYKKTVAFEVPAEIYNAYTTGDIVTITYKVANFNDVQYVVDATIKEE